MGMRGGCNHRGIGQTPAREPRAKVREEAGIDPDEVQGEPEDPHLSGFEHEAPDLDGIVNADGWPEPEGVGVTPQNIRQEGAARKSAVAAKRGASGQRHFDGGRRAATHFGGVSSRIEERSSCPTRQC